MMLLKPNCECCDADLPPEAENAFICTFECTWCADCATNVLKGKCLNCGGNLVQRPNRPAEALSRYPASTERVLSGFGPCKALREVAA